MSVLTWPDEGISVLGMSTTAATQESKVTLNTVINASQVQEGDKIRVTTQDGDRTNTYTGVANNFKLSDVDGTRRWFTKGNWTLWTADDSAVIELLDRPGPVLPNKSLAIVHYQYTPFAGQPAQKRTAVRDADGAWTAYDDDGFRMNGFLSDADFSAHMRDHSSASDLVVAFGGVAK